MSNVLDAKMSFKRKRLKDEKNRLLSIEHVDEMKKTDYDSIINLLEEDILSFHEAKHLIRMSVFYQMKHMTETEEKRARNKALISLIDFLEGKESRENIEKNFTLLKKLSSWRERKVN